MCTGVEIALAAGAAVSAISSISGGKAQKDAANEQASQVDLEARQKAASIRRLGKQARAGARADYSAAGVDVGSGTPVLIDRSIAYHSEVDALNALASGAATAKSIRKSGQAAEQGSILGAAGSAISTYGMFLALA